MNGTPLARTLDRIDGRSYPAYRDIRGVWDLPGGELVVDHVQGDPYASPSRIRVRVPSSLGAHTEAQDRIATEDWLLRRFAAALPSTSRGSGRSGQLEVYRPGPEVCLRSAVTLHPDHIEVRLRAGLPAKGRRVLARQAVAMFHTDLATAMTALHGRDGLTRHLASVRRQRALRDALDGADLVAFVADGSVLPRTTGVSRHPLPDAVPFRSPPSLSVTLDTPEGPVTGMGVPRGITLIVGGGYHGKSTLLDALSRGHLDHIPGDGREGVVSVPNAVAVQADEGRAIRGVDISAFLEGLPTGADTRHFSTDDASGSTSQSAAIAEALEAGCTCLLMDEDRSATNLLVRDARMAQLVPDEHEPITPLVRRIRSLHDDVGVSSILVCGGVSDFLDVADTVIGMRDYIASDLTQAATALVRSPERPALPMPRPAPRVLTGGLDADRVRARDARTVQLGHTDVDLAAVRSVLDAAHARTLALCARFIGSELLDGRRTLAHQLDALAAILADEGLDILTDRVDGMLVGVRPVDVGAVLSRVRSLTVARDV